VLGTTGIRVVPTDRGGDVTYHGPGQLVAYPITRLAHPKAARPYVEALQQACVTVAGAYGLAARGDAERTGVWVGHEKLVAIGVRVERGTLYEVQPGAGRMFGLLSVNALPRRLSLDFSDVYRRGLAFDSISGTFRLADGHAHTDDLRLSGPAARVEIKGRAGLAALDYDQEAVVVASFASSLAIAGTLAGGPGVGAAMLIASEILRGPLEDMARVRYRVTGSWDHPVVERVAEPR
jgi:hypothetical protein